MAFAHKESTTIGLTGEAKNFGKLEAKRKGMSLGVYIEQLIRKDMEEKKKETNQ